MTADTSTRQHDRAIAAVSAHACRDRKRQLLQLVDDEGALAVDVLMKAADATVCDASHDILFADLTRSGVFEDKGFGELSLSRAGNDWLLDHGQPSPDWAATHPSHLPTLRDWQVEALDAWAQHGRHGVIQAVTGTGKSRVGVEAAREALADGYSVVVCVPTIELVEQWVKTLTSMGIRRVGRASGDHRASLTTHQIVVGTVQTLYRLPPTRVDGRVLLIADECHRYGAREWATVLQKSYRRRLGLTATFERNDDGLATLLAYFGGGPVFDIDFRRAIGEGVVAHYDVKLVGVSLTQSERSAYDTAEKALSDCKQELVADGVTVEPFGVFMHEVTELASGDGWDPMQHTARRYLKEFSRRTEIVSNASAKFDSMTAIAPQVAAARGALVFTRRVDTAEELAERLAAAGVNAKPIHSDQTRTLRAERLAELRRGAVKALVAPTVLDEGVDVPDIDLAVVMGGSRSRRQMIQRMGRVLRLKKDAGKATFVVVYAKNTVEDITVRDGVEGCLDLITASADSVVHLNPRDLSATPTGPRTPVAATPVRRDAPAESARPKVRCIAAADHADSRRFGSPRVTPSSPAEQHDDVDLQEVSLTRSVLDQHVEAHGGTTEHAAAEIQQLARDFQAGARRSRDAAGCLVVRRAEFVLVTDPSGDRFIRYRSLRSKLPWSHHTHKGEAAVWVQRPTPTSAPHGPPVAWSKPEEFCAKVDPRSVCFTVTAFGQAAKMLGLLGEQVDDRAADDLLRLELEAALRASRVDVQKDGTVRVASDKADWMLSPDGCTVVRVRQRSTPVREALAPTVELLPPAAPHPAGGIDPAPADSDIADPTTGQQPGPSPRHRSEDSTAVSSSPSAGSPLALSAQASAGDDLVSRIERLAALRGSGLLTDAEFSAAKAKLLFDL